MRIGSHLPARLAAWAVVLGLVALAGAAWAQDAPDVPPGDGAIAVRVVDAEDGTPIAGVDVALYALSAEGVPGLRHGKSDEQGRFRFEKVSRSPSLAYLVGARYAGVPYPGSRLSFEDGSPEQEVEIRITALTADPGDLVAGRAELRLQRTADGVRVVQTLHVENRGDRTFYVPAADRAQHTPALRALLPRGAGDFEMPLGVVPEGVVREGRRIAWWGPVHPGRQDLSFSTVLPLPGSENDRASDSERTRRTERLSLRWTLPSGASAVRVWVPTAAELRATGLSPAKQPAEGAAGFAAFEGPALRAGGGLDLVVQLPPAHIDPEAVRPMEVRAILSGDDAALEVTETHMLRVEGKERVLGTPSRPLYRVTLPPGVSRLRFGASAEGVSLMPDDRGGLALQGEVDPGELRVEVAYRLATEGFPLRFDRRFDRRIPLLSIFLADTGDLRPRSDRLHRRRPVRTADLTYMHFEAFEVEPEETVQLEVDRQPPHLRLGPWVQRGSVALGGVVVLLLLAAPLWSGRAGTPPEAEAPETPAARERAALVAALRDLEHDAETGKIAPQDYEGLRQELRAQALALWKQERETSAEAGRGEEAPTSAGAPVPSAARFCTQCGTRAGADHVFCAQCGSRLRGKPDEVGATG